MSAKTLIVKGCDPAALHVFSIDYDSGSWPSACTEKLDPHIHIVWLRLALSMTVRPSSEVRMEMLASYMRQGCVMRYIQEVVLNTLCPDLHSFTRIEARGLMRLNVRGRIAKRCSHYREHELSYQVLGILFIVRKRMEAGKIIPPS